MYEKPLPEVQINSEKRNICSYYVNIIHQKNAYTHTALLKNHFKIWNSTITWKYENNTKLLKLIVEYQSQVLAKISLPVFSHLFANILSIDIVCNCNFLHNVPA